MPPWVRHVKRILGVGFCHYESTALTVDDDGVVPKWTSLCHPNPDGGHMENRIRLGLALGSCLWVFVHLMRPWVLRWSRRGAR